MKYSQASPGRIFVLRLEQGETVHEQIEMLARREGITAAALLAVGGADSGSILVVGPESGRGRPVRPLEHVLPSVHEIAGVGTLFPDEDGYPVVHMHMACGRREQARTGCIRRGVVVWQVMEIILWELTGTAARRLQDPETGFALLDPSPR